MKKLILFAVIFALGFFTHAIFFPDTFSNILVDTKNIVIPDSQPTPEGNKLITTITYDGERFSDHSLHITTTSYVVIKNNSKEKRMELVSNNPLLTTPRPYGFSEAINQRLDKAGTYVVRDKTNPNEEIVIVVK